MDESLRKSIKFGIWIGLIPTIIICVFTFFGYITTEDTSVSYYYMGLFAELVGLFVASFAYIFIIGFVMALVYNYIRNRK